MLWWALTILLAFSVAGNAEEKVKIAVVEFDAQGDIRIPDAGAIVAEWLTASLVGNDVFDVKERLSLQRVIEEQNLGQSGRVDPKTVARVGHLLGVSAILTGTVVQLGPDFPIYVSVRMIDTKTGSITNHLREKAQGIRDLESTVTRLGDRLSGKEPQPAPASSGSYVSSPASSGSSENTVMVTPTEQETAPSTDQASDPETSNKEEGWSFWNVFRSSDSSRGENGLFTREAAPPPASEKRAAVLEIRSSPAGADVFYMDRSESWLAPYGPSEAWTFMGKTPYINRAMPVGKYWIRVALGSKEEVLEAVIKEGRTTKKMVPFALIGQGGMGDRGGM